MNRTNTTTESSTQPKPTTPTEALAQVARHLENAARHLARVRVRTALRVEAR
jgi:hypothetical protein